MAWQPHVTVAAVVERNGSFLVVEELINGVAVFNQPAGHLEPGETLIEAVIRETLEETAGHFIPDAVIGIYRWTVPGGRMTFLRACFSGRCTAFDAGRRLDAAILRAVWMDRDELVQHHARLRSPMVLRCIDDYLKGIRHPLTVLTDLDRA